MFCIVGIYNLDNFTSNAVADGEIYILLQTKIFI